MWPCKLVLFFWKNFEYPPQTLPGGLFTPPKKISKNCSKNVQKLNNFLLWWLIELNKISFVLTEIDRLSREKIFFSPYPVTPWGVIFTQKNVQKRVQKCQNIKLLFVKMIDWAKLGFIWIDWVRQTF